MKQEKEEDNIEEIKKVLEESGVENLDSDDELNIDMAEYEGWPPRKVGWPHRKV